MKVIVGLSGGVDSAVSALLCKQAGHEVEAVFMQNWDEDDEFCTIRQDYQDCEAIAQALDIPLQRVNFAKTYWDKVFEHFLSEYSKCRTPNPDILCNKEVKFRAFLDYAKAHGADAIATGHYAGIDREQGQASLRRGADRNKDQSYFLYAIDRACLDFLMFPLQDLQKQDVRAIAQRADLHIHDKADSTGICFIGERDFNAFLNQYLPAKPGDIRNLSGRLIGQHGGLMHYTLGQRKGLGIGGVAGFDEQPWFVVDKQLSDNTLIVAQGTDHPSLYHHHLECGPINWLVEPPQGPLACSAKTRYRQADQACELQPNAKGGADVIFKAPVRAMTPGQSVVFYAEDLCLGGAVIEHVSN